jgi:GNAT superfamily N-acetyltransferase
MSVHIINRNTENFTKDIVSKVLEVSTSIFYLDECLDKTLPPLEINNAANSINHWMEKIENHDGEILYMRSEANDEIAAFTYTCLHRASEISSDSPSYHIWVAGCLRDYRRNGFVSKLFKTLSQRASSRGYTRLTVNTFPRRFVHMPRFLESQGFTRYDRPSEGENLAEMPHDEKWSYHKIL